MQPPLLFTLPVAACTKGLSKIRESVFACGVLVTVGVTSLGHRCSALVDSRENRDWKWMTYQ